MKWKDRIARLFRRKPDWEREHRRTLIARHAENLLRERDIRSITDLVRRHRKAELTIAGIGLTMNTATSRFLRTPEDAAGKDMLELMEALHRTSFAKKIGGASRTFRQTPHTPCTACWPCTPFSWMPIWSSTPTANSRSLRWTRCRPQRISSTGSSAPKRSVNFVIWQKHPDAIRPPVTSHASTTGTPTWGRCRRCAAAGLPGRFG